MSELTSSNWSETSASNNQPPPNGWPEGQAPSTLNDCAREMMGALKRWWNRDHASANVTVGGTANAITLTYSQPPAAYVQGEKFAFKATANNTGPTTVQVGTLAAVNVVRTGGSALTGNEITSGQVVELVYDGTNFQLITASSMPAGAMTPFAGSVAPSGWLLCDGSAVSRTTYAVLFTAIGTAWGTGDGSTTFNVPNMLGRVPVGAGSAGSYAQTIGSAAVTTASSQITIAANDEIKTGTPLVYTTSGTAIGGLTAGNIYYAIVVDSTHIKLASSLANALGAGTTTTTGQVAISLTTQGTGNHTFTKNLTARTLGATGGEEAHSLTAPETGPHSHTYNVNGSGAAGVLATGDGTGGALSTNVSGAGAAHNNMQPYAGVNWIIKT